MGDSGIVESNEEKLSSFTEIFKEQCPFFMSIGMSYQEYWYEDCWIASYYLKAWRLKKEQKNEEMWLQGVYIYEAICDVAPVLHAFSKKGTKPHPYPEKPYSLFKKSKKEEKKDEQKQVQETYEYFKQWSSSVSRKFEIEKKKNENK